MASSSNMILFWGSGSVPCWKAMLALEEKGLQGYKSKLISFSDNETKGEEIMKLNPRGEVPTFRDGDVIVNESGAICDYLEYKYSDQGIRLLPKDSAQRAKVLQRAHEAQNLYKALIEGMVHYQFYTKPEDIDQELLDTKRKTAREELHRWEDYLKQEGPYMAGKEFSMADILIFPVLAFAIRGKLNMEPFPALNSYYEKLLERPSVKATWPPHWKEAPVNNILQSANNFTGV